MNWHLIITGPERRNIWWITGEGMRHTIPKRDFLRGYTGSLEGAELVGVIDPRRDHVGNRILAELPTDVFAQP
jgi:hypothetical protein